MTCTCPNCGFALERIEPFTVGELTVDGEFGDVTWRGVRVPLTPREKAIVITLARGDGTPIKRIGLAEVIGSDELLDPGNLVDVMICKARRKFRELDASFDRIESVWGVGVRWRI